VSTLAPSDIRIPAHLLPVDGRFGSGPSKVGGRAIEALHRAGSDLLGTSHRQAPVRDLVARIRGGLRTLFSLPDDHLVVLGNGGTTLFWDVATLGLIDRRSQHLAFGEFSRRFAEIAGGAPHVAEAEVITAAPGGRPQAVGRPGVDLYALTHNETSTGVVADLSRPTGADPDALVAVDATSAAGAIPWDPAVVDAYYFAPQKVFASDGGLWLAVLSPAAAERVARLRAGDRWIPASLDLAVAMAQSALDQTLNTPSIATLVLMAEQLDWILEGGGMAFAEDRCGRSAAHLYGWAEARPWARPFVYEVAARSPVVGTIDFDDAVPAATLAAVLRANGVVEVEPYRKLGRNQLRIGMFPAVDPGDVEALTACIDHIVGRL
jgi:phosphoserine aminotransferase